jgi:ABC-type branched-subunit amino acid transport system permease subunit
MIARYELEPRYYLALGLALVTAETVYLLPKTRVSLGILAVREDEEAAEAAGVNALRHKLVALALSSFFAGLAGGVFAYYHVSFYPSFTFSPAWTFDAVLATFIGGIGRSRVRLSAARSSSSCGSDWQCRWLRYTRWSSASSSSSLC